MEFKWYTLKTLPGWEEKVAASLTKNSIENYYPVHFLKADSATQRKDPAEPLLASYVFVRISLRMLHLLNNIQGIKSLVYWLGRPAVTRDHDILQMKRLLNCQSKVVVLRSPVNIHERFKIIERLNRSTTAGSLPCKIFLHSLGYIITSEIEGKLEANAVNSLKIPIEY